MMVKICGSREEIFLHRDRGVTEGCEFLDDNQNLWFWEGIFLQSDRRMT